MGVKPWAYEQSLVWPLGRAITRSSLEQDFWGSNLGLVKSDTVLPTLCHRCDISSKEAVLLGHNDTKLSPVNSLHALVYYNKYNVKDLICKQN